MLPPLNRFHFVGFRGDEYWSAVKISGKPGFIHRGWDSRAVQDIHPDDTVIFAKGTEADRHASPIKILTSRDVGVLAPGRMISVLPLSNCLP